MIICTKSICWNVVFIMSIKEFGRMIGFSLIHKKKMIEFTKNGNKYHKPEYIRVGAAFKLSKLDSGIFTT